jgi:hypothetical protein
MEIAEFLLARIAEDERVVEQHRQLHDEGEWDKVNPHKIVAVGPRLTIDPARVLAECEAKRRIVGWFQTLGAMTDRDSLETRHNELLHVLSALALPHADHPDYRQEWKP